MIVGIRRVTLTMKNLFYKVKIPACKLFLHLPDYSLDTNQVLMWLAELLGQERGMDICLKNASSAEWVFDPHTEVDPGYWFLGSLQIP